MRLLIMLLMAIAVPLWGKDAEPVEINQAPGDTLWILRAKDSRTAKVILKPGWKFISTSVDKKPNIACSIVVRDSLGRAVGLSYRTRLFGVDTTRFELRYTTEDSLPSSWGESKYILDAQGKFAVRKEKIEELEP